MFNTMTITKAAGAVLGALLFFLLGNWAASALYSIGGDAHGEAEAHAGMTATPGDLLDSGEEDGAAEEQEEVAALALDSGDAAAGEKVFGKCKACHKVDGANATGPHLDGVVGRPVASVDGFAYSNGMVAHGGDWTLEALNEFLTKPKAVVADTKMAFAGLPKEQDRVDLLAYLQSISN